jgi:G3E family GTPase
VRLAAWPDEDRRSRLVFITRDLDRAELEATLREAGVVPA